MIELAASRTHLGRLCPRRELLVRLDLQWRRVFEHLLDSVEQELVERVKLLTDEALFVKVRCNDVPALSGKTLPSETEISWPPGWNN